MFLVGLTGGISTGKSTVSDIFKKRGINVIDADQLARQVVEPGKPAYIKLRETFGSEFFDDNNGGVLLRENLADVVFNDKEKRQKLNSITHKEVQSLMIKAIFKEFFRGSKYVVLDIPLLFETGAHKMVQKTVVVHCDERTQLLRLKKRDGIDEEKAKARISAQMPIADKVKLATYAIDNNGSEEELEAKVNDVIQKLNQSWIPVFMRTTIVGLISLVFAIILKILL